MTNARSLANFATGIGTEGAVLTVDNTNNRIGIATTNPQNDLQVGAGITMEGDTGQVTFVGVVTASSFSGDIITGGIDIVGNTTGLNVTGVGTFVDVNVSGAATIAGATDLNGALDVNGEVTVSPNTAGKNTITLTTNSSNDGRVLVKSDTTTKVDIQANGTSFFDGGSVEFRSADAVGIADSIFHIGDTNTKIRFPAADTFTVETGGSEAFRVDSSQRLILGATSAIDTGTASLIQAVSANGARIVLARNDTSTAQNDSIGRIRFYGNDSDGNYDECARLEVIADADHTSTSKASALTLHTTASGAESPTERLRITSAGNLSMVSGATILYGDGDVLFTGDSGNFNWDKSDSSLKLQDNAKAKFGTGDDLEIYHTGSASNIYNNTGNLVIRNNHDDSDIYLQTDDSSGGVATYVLCDGSAGKVRLYHYGTEKFQTKSDGIDVTGEVECDSLDVDGSGDIAGTLTTNRLIVDDDGSDSPLLSVRADDSSPWGVIVSNFTYSANDDHGLAFAVDNDGDGTIRLIGDGVYEDLRLQQTNGTTTQTAIHVDTNRAVNIKYQNSTKLATTSSGVTVTGTLNATTAVTQNGASLATAGKAVAMALVFG